MDDSLFGEDTTQLPPGAIDKIGIEDILEK
jgi:hypothetical protein